MIDNLPETCPYCEARRTSRIGAAQYACDTIICSDPNKSDDQSCKCIIAERNRLVGEVAALRSKVQELGHCAEIAWGIIANVNEGNWSAQSKDWIKAAKRWRDEQFTPQVANLEKWLKDIE